MKILVLYYSRYGHVLKLARSVLAGVNGVDGAEGVLRRAAEFPGEEELILKNQYSRKVWEEQKDIPVCTNQDLREARGLVIGSPTRYGNMIAQMKRVLDGTVELWLKGEMEGKPAAIFTSTSSTHGGQESTSLSMAIPLLHLGMLIVGVPYSTPGMIHTDGRGSTPYGASVLAGARNELEPHEQDLAIGEALGRRVAEIAIKLGGS